MADEAAVVVRDSGHAGHPIGTRAEVIEQHLDPRVVPTCSQPIAGINVGCGWYDHKTLRCIFPERNSESGPENTGFYKKLPSGEEQGFVMPCFIFMGNEFDLWRQRHNTHVRYSDKFYVPGEQITRLVHQPRHPEPVQTCHRCRTGNCSLTDRVKITETIEKFPRPTESIQDGIFPHDEGVAGEPISLEFEARNQPKTGSQVEQIMAERKRARQISERASGTP